MCLDMTGKGHDQTPMCESLGWECEKAHLTNTNNILLLIVNNAPLKQQVDVFGCETHLKGL